MEGVIDGRSPRWLEPLPYTDHSTVGDLDPDDKVLNFWLRITEMASVLLTKDWRDRLAISELEIGATFRDGKRFEESKIMPSHWKVGPDKVADMMTKLMRETVADLAGWSGRRLLDIPKGQSRLNRIVEFTVRFTCIHRTVDHVDRNDEARPFSTKQVFRDLGTWNYFLCMSGTTTDRGETGSNPASRIIFKKIR